MHISTIVNLQVTIRIIMYVSLTTYIFMHVSTTIYYGSLNMINNNYFNHFIYRLEDANGLNDNDVRVDL